MRNAVRSTLVGVVLLTAATTGGSAATAVPAESVAPSKQEHTYSIPVLAVTDVGDLTKVANLGTDLAGLLGH
ncbi:hypothetical protein OG689_38465 [Kitasatospora sp. NBC_00240]|uniref:hypothetical protein n=1 Tax=Kitasatospora sp. NBC_00240 TaxID=2903567 RepID=UPI0022550359|nr:hypothetical protein [Kitasatospora sp. NBC_00240]MCX5215080.1 hypothetical protein [Kitasatospora sp. NBC_00240]